MVKRVQTTTASVTISCYWQGDSKAWLLVARDDRGRVLARERVESSAALDAPGARLLLRGMRAELESHLV